MQETLQKHLYRYRHSLVPRQLGYEASTDKKRFVLNYFTQAAQTENNVQSSYYVNHSESPLQSFGIAMSFCNFISCMIFQIYLVSKAYRLTVHVKHTLYYSTNHTRRSIEHASDSVLSVLSKDLVRVKATVTEHSRTAKVIVFKKKRRKNYKRKKGICMTHCYNYRVSPRKSV